MKHSKYSPVRSPSSFSFMGTFSIDSCEKKKRSLPVTSYVVSKIEMGSSISHPSPINWKEMFGAFGAYWLPSALNQFSEQFLTLVSKECRTIPFICRSTTCIPHFLCFYLKNVSMESQRRSKTFGKCTDSSRICQ